MKKLRSTLSIGLVALATSAPAWAQSPDAPAEEGTTPPAPTWPASRWRVEVGYRGSYITDSGFDPFAKTDALPQLSVGASLTVAQRGRLSFAPGLAWDHGGRSATARGAASSLTLDRVTVPLEGRFHVDRWGYAFVRVAPGFVAQTARLEDPSAGVPYTKSRALFATDLSAGYALPLFRLGRRESAPTAWLQADGGYGWVATERLDLAPDAASDDPRRTRGIDLGSLATSGAFFRAGLAVSF